ncbi:NYN domain-containing protein [Candidatus Peregrinibacteria bacterium]|nr:NYN domain-containing protein [Candidatus Peregrinibacteria bacterium]
MPNNYAFIDSQNVHLGVRDQGWLLDWRRFRVYLREKYDVAQAYVFIGYRQSNESLYTALQKAGYILIFKPTLEFRYGKRMVTKGNVDAELVLHTMIEYPNYDQAVIVSGDGDFHCLIKYLFEQGKLRRLIVPNLYKYSRLLRAFSQHITYLNKLREKVGAIKTRGISSGRNPLDSLSS